MMTQLAHAHLVSVKWAFGPSSLSLRASPSSPSANRASRDGQRSGIFSGIFVVHRTTFAEGDARGGSARSDEGDERPHLTGTKSASAIWPRIVLADFSAARDAPSVGARRACAGEACAGEAWARAAWAQATCARATCARSSWARRLAQGRPAS